MNYIEKKLSLFGRLTCVVNGEYRSTYFSLVLFILPFVGGIGSLLYFVSLAHCSPGDAHRFHSSGLLYARRYITERVFLDVLLLLLLRPTAFVLSFQAACLL